MHTWSVILRWSVHLLGAFILCLILLIVGLRVWIITDNGRNFIVSKLDGRALGGYTLQLEGLEGDLLKAFSIRKLQIVDAEGVWFTAETVKLDWNSRKLITRELSIASATAQKITFRQPRTQLVSGSQDARGGVSLRVIDLAKIDFPQIIYSDKAFEPMHAFSMSGSAFHNADSSKLDLDLSPFEEDGDTVSVNLKRALGLPLSGSARIYARAGGWITDLIALPATDSLTFNLRASGNPGDDWSLESDLNISGTEVLTLSGRGQASRATLDARLSNALPWLPPLITGKIGSEARLHLEAVSLGENTYDVQGNASSQFADLKLSGKPSGQHDIWTVKDLIAKVTFPQPEGLQDLTGVMLQSAEFEGQLTYASGENMSLAGQYGAEQILTKFARAPSAKGKVQVDLKGMDLSVDTNANLRGLVAGDGRPLPLLGTSPDLRASLTVNTGDKTILFRALNIRGADLSLAATGTTTNLSGKYDLNLASFDLGDTSSLKGRFTAKTEDLDATALSLTGNLTGLDSMARALTPELSLPIAFNLDLFRTKDGTINLTRLFAQSAQASLLSSGSLLASGVLSLDIAAKLEELTYPGLDRFAGISLVTRLRGSLDAVEFDNELSIAKISNGALEASDLTANLKGNFTEQRLASDLDLRAETPHGVFTIRATPALAGSELQTGPIKASLANFTLKGTLATALEGDMSPTGALHIEGVPEGIPFETLTLDLVLSAAANQLTGRARTKAFGALKPTEIKVLIDGSPVFFKAGITLETEHKTGAAPLPIRLNVNTTGSLTKREIEIRLDGRYADFPIRTVTPIKMLQTGTEAQLSGRIEGFSGSLDLSGNYTDAGLVGSVDLQSFAIGPLVRLLEGRALDGLLSTSVRLDTQRPDKTMTLESDLRDLTLAGDSFDNLTLSLSGKIQNGTFKVDTLAKGETTDFIMGLSGLANWDNDLPEFNLSVPMNLTLNGQGLINPFAALFLPPEAELTGQLKTDLDLTLLPNSITGNGTLAFDKARFEQGDLGLLLTDLELNSVLQGTTLRVVQLSARDGTQGRISGSGLLSLDGSKKDKLSLSARKFRAVNRSDADAQLSGDLTLEQEKGVIILGAALKIDEANIRLDRLVVSTRPTLPVRFKGEPNIKTSTPSLIKLDVQIEAPGQIFAEGRGLDAELGMTASIRGTAQNPVVTARADVLRGNYNFAGQIFDLVDSSITLPANSNEANLQITAERETTDLTAIIEITGTQDRPIITLSSSPALPEDEILSRILFGLVPGELTSLQSARLAATLASLAGGSGFNVLNRLEDLLFLDRIDLTESDNGDAVITTGKYIRPNVYIEAENRLNGDVGVALDWEATDNITIRGETGAENGQEVSIRWRYEFDRLGNKRKDNGPSEKE